MKKSIKISGDGFISKGEYDVVKIMGDASSIGDVYAREVKINGNTDIDEFVLTGNCKFSFDIRCDIINITGDIYVENNIYAKEININGLVKVKGNIECENITIKGSIQCEGTLKAQSASIYPYSESDCNEIKSSKIEILKYKRRNILNLCKEKYGRFSCKLMKGDDIKLENTDVEYIEYTKNLNISEDCKIEKSLKII